MEQSRLQIALTVLALLLPEAAAAQNPCGYAFTITGQQLYDQHCAACHGKDGKGDGPLAGAQKTAPANLTKIEQRNGGQFPGDRIADIIRFGGGIPGHETEGKMPVWGKVFSGECGPAFSRRAVVELDHYLRQMQK
ncbi:MAG: cytochrome c [Rhodomicrobium sp.]